MKKCYPALAMIAVMIALAVESGAQTTTRSLTWNVFTPTTWTTGSGWDNKANWLIAGTGLAPTTNVTNGDKLIIPNSAPTITIGGDMTIAFNNFAIETQGNAKILIQSGFDLTLSGASTAFSMNKATANNGLLLEKRSPPNNPTQLIVGVIVKATNTGTSNTPITISSTATSSVQALSSDGATASTQGFGGFILGVLPVSLGNFSANLTGAQKVGLSWTTLQEINTDHFDLQRSTDAGSWKTIATVKAAGNSSTAITYSFSDITPAAGSNFYRLLMVDADGKSTISTVKTIRLSAIGKVSVYPNPASNVVNVSLGQVPRNEWHLTITNNNGQVVLNNRYSANTTVVNLPVNTYANGTYSVQIADGSDVQISKIVVSHR
jgi:hypothetical protein